MYIQQPINLFLIFDSESPCSGSGQNPKMYIGTQSEKIGGINPTNLVVIPLVHPAIR